MLQVNTKVDIVPSTESMCRLLTASNQQNGLYLDYDRLLEYHFYYRNEFGRIAKALYKVLKPNDSVPRLATAADLKAWIADCRLGYLFGTTDGGDISLDDDSIKGAVNSGALNDEQKTILNYYSYAASCSAKVGQFGTILWMDLDIEDELSCELHRMIRIDPVWVGQNTHRFATNTPALQNFTQDTQDVITVPRGYTKCDADSGQIEPRITYSTIIKDPVIKHCINEYNDAYYGLYYYTQMPEDLWLSKRYDFKVPEINAEMEEGRKALKTIGNAVLYGSADTKNGDPIYTNYARRIGQHPMRLAYFKKCEEQIMRGDYIFYTAFGEPVDVRKAENAKGKYSKASQRAQMAHYARSAFNVSMQGTAAGLMKMAVKHENQYLLRNNLKSYIMLSVHDAIKTAVHEDEYDKHGEYIANIPSYQVDDWIPIYSGVEWGPHRTNKVFSEDMYY